MKVLGIVGRSGVGKSYISSFFLSKGALVIDGDEVAHRLMSRGGALVEELAEAFGRRIVGSDGSADRKALAEIVFSDPEKLALLNKISHRHICREFDRLIADSRAPFAVIDAAALIESGYTCDHIIAVTAPDSVSLARICERDGLDGVSARKRLTAQHNDEFYISHADFVIVNDGRDFSALLEEIYEEII